MSRKKGYESGRIRAIIFDCGCGQTVTVPMEELDFCLEDGSAVIPDRFTCNECIIAEKRSEKMVSA